MPNGNSNQFRRRLPALERKIVEISADRDVRVRLTGMVIGVSESSLMMDDGTGKVEVLFDGPEALAGIREGQMVRIFARILPLIDGFECRGECVQNLEGFDMGLYEKARAIMVR